MIIEGAGSPAEVNLKKNDITNMNMAFYAEAPVLIAGDIDRGGVFASFIGCMETFTEKERKLVAGFLVNRFRGDEKLLGDALDYMKKHTGKKVLGVIPFIKNLMLPEEDSVVLSREFWSRNKNSECVEICVINLPHFSNFTDFDAFRTEKDVVLKLAGNISEIENPDALIIPGSKNVIADMKFLEDTGIASRIRTLASSHDCLITGICGGYQMLGITLEDPCRIESGFLSNPGLGLLDVHTVLEKEKQLRQINACHIKSGEKVSGYEIHHGRTFSNEPLKVLETEGAGDAGAESRCGRISGVYMHGFFDSDGFRRWFINGLRQKKGLCPGVSESFSQGIEKELDRLADIVRACVDMKNICQITGL